MSFFKGSLGNSGRGLSYWSSFKLWSVTAWDDNVLCFNPLPYNTAQPISTAKV